MCVFRFWFESLLLFKEILEFMVTMLNVAYIVHAVRFIYLITGSLYVWPPSPIFTTPHVWQPSVCALSLRDCIFFKIPHRSEIIQHLSFSSELASCSLSICVVAKAGFPSFWWWMAFLCIHTHTPHFLMFIHRWALSLFPNLDPAQNATVNTEVQISLPNRDFISFR